MAAKLSSQIKTIIAAGTALSPAVCVFNSRLVAIQMPAAWTAAVLTFQVSMDNLTYTDLYDSFGSEVSVAVAASHGVSLDVTVFAGWAFFKIRSGTGAAPVNQVAAAALFLNSIQLVA